MVGRSHGIHAEPITLWFASLVVGKCCGTKIASPTACQQIAVGKISGAVGTYANIEPRVEAIACQKLGLEPDTASTQVISRDRHADLCTTVGSTGSLT